MHKLGVQARDLRLLDLTSATPPAILDRDKAIIVNLWHIKVGAREAGEGRGAAPGKTERWEVRCHPPRSPGDEC